MSQKIITTNSLALGRSLGKGLKKTSKLLERSIPMPEFQDTAATTKNPVESWRTHLEVTSMSSGLKEIDPQRNTVMKNFVNIKAQLYKTTLNSCHLPSEPRSPILQSNLQQA
jgi:hypothetical protein